MAWKQIAKLTGVSVKVVPYDGGGPTSSLFWVTRLTYSHGDCAPVAHIRTGKLRILATLSEKREKDWPDVPTARELGVDVVNHNWRGIWLPRARPDRSLKNWPRLSRR